MVLKNTTQQLPLCLPLVDADEKMPGAPIAVHVLTHQHQQPPRLPFEKIYIYTLRDTSKYCVLYTHPDPIPHDFRARLGLLVEL